MNKRNNFITAAVIGVIALIVGGIIGYAVRGDGSSSGSTASISSLAGKGSSTAHNDQDVSFAQMMIEHHTQAVSMAKMADTQAGSTDVKKLASRIEAAQGPEITMMSGWLKSWGKSSSMGGMDMGGMSSGSMSGMDHGSDSMPGSMSQADMDKLSSLSGAAFDKQFLSMMIEHHNGAITMAKDELSKGKYSDALGLAASIQITQQAQVEQMRSTQ